MIGVAKRGWRGLSCISVKSTSRTLRPGAARLYIAAPKDAIHIWLPRYVYTIHCFGIALGPNVSLYIYSVSVNVSAFRF